jgi:hypothetical protein
VTRVSSPRNLAYRESRTFSCVICIIGRYGVAKGPILATSRECAEERARNSARPHGPPIIPLLAPGFPPFRGCVIASELT